MSTSNTYHWYNTTSATTSSTSDYYVVYTRENYIIDDISVREIKEPEDPFDDEQEDDSMYCERIGI